MKTKLCIFSLILGTFLNHNLFGNTLKNKETTNLSINHDKNIFISIRLKWVDFLTGRKFINNLSTEEKDNYITSINKSGESILSTFSVEKTNVKNGVDIYKAYTNLKILGKIYNTPGSKFYKSIIIKNKINSSLEWLNENAYYIGAPELGNWWQWELGIPKAINEIVALMYEEIPIENQKKYLKASQYFQPYAKYSGYSSSAVYSSSPDKRISKGGNRMDTVIISFMRGVLMNDPIQIADATSATTDVALYVSSGDGFYSDGSFVQHGNIAYNGTYASVLFDGLGTILYLSQNTPYAIKNKEINNIYKTILNSYSYLFINGGITDGVSGRAISRNNSSDITRGISLLESMALLIKGAPSEYKKDLDVFAKTAIIDNNSSYNINSIKNLTIRNILSSIENNSDIQPNNIYGSRIFSGMDRVTYKTKKNGKFFLSMHSSRIGNYESMNGENIKGWHTGDGMTYIYGIDSNQFINYWPTVDMYHLPGTTESISPRRDKSGERRHKIRMSSKSWVGGATNGSSSIIGMDFFSWNNKTSGKKSWFMIDNSIIALGSNISSSDGVIHTTIDNRIIKKDNSNKLSIDGNIPENTLITLEGNLPNENFIYKVLKGDKLIIRKEKRSGTWKSIGGSSEDIIKENYFKAYIDHGLNPTNSNYAYVLLPMFTERDLKSYNFDSIKINQLNEWAHFIEKNNIKAINFWKDAPYKIDKFKTYSTLSLLVEENKNELILWASDPTQLSKVRSTLEIDGLFSLVSSNDPTLKIKKRNNKTILKFNTNNIGQTIKIHLKKQ